MVSVRETADDCSAPVVVPAAGPFPYSFFWNDQDGTTQASDPDSPCLPGRGRAGTTWFEFTPATTDSYVISTCTDVPTALTLFTGPACGPYTALPLSCQPIGGVAGCGQGSSSVTPFLPAGQTVRIVLGGVQEHNVGTVRLTVGLVTGSSGTPRVERVGAAIGPAGGGTEVVIQGQNFSANAEVSFGGVPATNVVVLSPRVITARTPPHAPGPVAVSVTVPGSGSGTLGNAFLYEPLESSARVPPQPPPHPRPIRTVAPR
jgi:hypothetical protein